MMDLMVDIETLGNRPGSVILSIGAVWFDAATGEFGDEFYAAINPQSATSSGLKMDASTVQWWMKQSDDARAAAFSGERILGWALGEFGDLVRKSEAKRIWAKPPSFDLVLLEAAFAACSIPIPWEYWTPRDCRTLFEISKVKQAAFGTAHNALDDAKAQAAGVIEAYRVLGLSEPPPVSHEEGLTWATVAQLADRHGIRYPTNAAMQMFLTSIGADEAASLPCSAPAPQDEKGNRQ